VCDCERKSEKIYLFEWMTMGFYSCYFDCENLKERKMQRKEKLERVEEGESGKVGSA
jgi:hypothetical protein